MCSARGWCATLRDLAIAASSPDMSTLDDLALVIDRVPFLGSIKTDLMQLRRILVDRRAPRILAIGSSGSGRTTLANELLAAAVLPKEGEHARVVAPEAQWVHVRAAGRSLDWLELDATEGGTLDKTKKDRLERALAEAEPDVILLCVAAPADLPELAALAATHAALLKMLRRDEGDGEKSKAKKTPQSMAVLTHVDRALGDVSLGDPEAKALLDRELAAFRAALEASQLSVPRPVACALDRDEPFHLEEVADEIYVRLPDAAQVEAARAFPVSRDKKREVARLVVHRTSTIAVTIGLAPVPFSDAVLLLPLQGMMVTAVAYIAGQPWDSRAAAEWLGSVGAIGAAAFGLRWGARQIVKLVPGAGTLLSASVAGTGTLAIGRSAIAYFIDGPGLRRPKAILPANAAS